MTHGLGTKEAADTQKQKKKAAENILINFEFDPIQLELGCTAEFCPKQTHARLVFGRLDA